MPIVSYPLSSQTRNECVAAPYNPKNKDRRLHRHSAFFGTMRECIEDCCEVYLASCFRKSVLTPAAQYCPEPGNAEEHGLQDEEDKLYVRGRVSCVMPSFFM